MSAKKSSCHLLNLARRRSRSPSIFDLSPARDAAAKNLIDIFAMRRRQLGLRIGVDLDSADNWRFAASLSDCSTIIENLNVHRILRECLRINPTRLSHTPRVINYEISTCFLRENIFSSRREISFGPAGRGYFFSARRRDETPQKIAHTGNIRNILVYCEVTREGCALSHPKKDWVSPRARAETYFPLDYVSGRAASIFTQRNGDPRQVLYKDFN